ncbi:MAG: hypothetical protein PQJ60_00975 [Spirochaetales bacterium]|nr:hypothetical protein [Spirochaetales bacterium]
MIKAGIDEAGLGPLLGPYCAGMTVFSSPEEDLYALLSRGISPEPAKGKVAVGDSKKLYTPAKGLGELEKSVLTFYTLLHEEAKDFGRFLKNISPDNPEDTPWFASCDKLTLPLIASSSEIEKSAEKLQKLFAEKNVTLQQISLRFITAAAFNRGWDKTQNKGTLCQEILHPLMAEALEKEDLVLTVDRQGGRRFYGDWLISLLSRQPLQALEERAQSSVYRSGSKTVQFLVGGDRLALETALASLFAKYARECAMILFNRYWEKETPGIKKTAGYYTDGMRFIADLEKAGKLPDHRDRLIRKK